MPLYRQGRGDLDIPRFLQTTQAILAQIATFLQQCDTQSNNLDDLENAGRGQNAESVLHRVPYGVPKIEYP